MQTSFSSFKRHPLTPRWFFGMRISIILQVRYLNSGHLLKDNQSSVYEGKWGRGSHHYCMIATSGWVKVKSKLETDESCSMAIWLPHAPLYKATQWQRDPSSTHFGQCVTFYECGQLNITEFSLWMFLLLQLFSVVWLDFSSLD